MQCVRVGLLCLLLPVLGGCTAFVAHQIEHPPQYVPKGHAVRDKALGIAHFTHQYLRVAPDVRLSYWHAWPHDLHVKITTRVAHSQHRYSAHWDFNFDGGDQAAALQPRGSVVLLPPWGGHAETMGMWGIEFANAGYVVVLPDLRGEGDSSDAPVGYGPREAGDVVTLMRTLYRRGQLPRPWFLLGHSYGATVALFTAARLPRVRGVVALAPFANAGAVLRRAPRSGLFQLGSSWWGRWLTDLMMDWATPANMNHVIARASRDLGVDLDDVDADPAVRNARACEVIVHGADDHLTSARALQRLARQSPRAAYVAIKGVGHVGLLTRGAVWLFKPVVAWMRALPAEGTGTCPVLHAPASDPLRARAKAAAKAGHG